MTTEPRLRLVCTRCLWPLLERTPDGDLSCHRCGQIVYSTAPLPYTEGRTLSDYQLGARPPERKRAMTSAATPPSAQVVELILDWPPIELSPNHRTKKGRQSKDTGKIWTAKSDASRKYKEDCRLLARSEMVAARMRGVTFPLPGPVRVTLTFVMRRWERRDGDNLIASFKAGFDGLVAAALIKDDSLKYLRPIIVEAETGPRQHVRVLLEAAA